MHVNQYCSVTTINPILRACADQEVVGVSRAPEEVSQVMEEFRVGNSSMFGYSVSSRSVGITGAIKLVSVGGGVVFVALTGRFWHSCDFVQEKARNYLVERFPEMRVIIDRSGVEC